jgi:hypothetical protein
LADIEKRQSTAIAPYDYGDDAALGYENVSSSDLLMPFIILCQALTPMVQDRRAQAGDYWDTVKETAYPAFGPDAPGIEIVPAFTRHVFAKWVPRDEAKGGSGFRGQLDPDDPVVLQAIQNSKKFGRYEIEQEGEDDRGRAIMERILLRDTYYLYCVLVEDEAITSKGAVIAFTSTKIKPYRSMMTRLLGFERVPLFAHHLRLRSVQQENAKGKFYVPSISPANPMGLRESLLAPDDPRYLTAKTLRELIQKGQASADYASQAAEGEDDGYSGSVSGSGDGDLPF